MYRKLCVTSVFDVVVVCNCNAKFNFLIAIPLFSLRFLLHVVPVLNYITILLAWVASVSARVRRENLGREQKTGMTGKGEGSLRADDN